MKAPLDSNVFNPLGNVILVYALLFLLIFFFLWSQTCVYHPATEKTKSYWYYC